VLLQQTPDKSETEALALTVTFLSRLDNYWMNENDLQAAKLFGAGVILGF